MNEKENRWIKKRINEQLSRSTEGKTVREQKMVIDY